MVECKRIHESGLTPVFSSTAEQILGLVLEIGNAVLLSESNLLSLEAFDFHLERIERVLLSAKPIQFILPAFPAKSPNPEKTLGPLPDFGEVLALRKLNDLCAKISALHAPGASVMICSDGRVFSDLVQVEDPTVNAYTQRIREIIDEQKLENLSTFCLEDIFDDSPDFTAMRSWLVETYGATTEELRENIRTQVDFRCMFNGIHRFMFEDRQALRPELSKNQAREQAKQLAYGVIQRSNAWSALLEEYFPLAVRLSIHPQLSSSKKIGVRLLPSNDIWRTPWHSVTLFDGRDFTLVARKEAEVRGACLVQMHGKYACYVLSPEAQV